MMRVGQGFDVHAFDAQRPLMLGGVAIPDHPGLAGHSDADVLSHAVADALLGAASLGDLGALFPASDRWSGASSLDILRESALAVERAGWSVANVDATVIGRSPKLAPHRQQMISNLAAAVGIDGSCVSVKATTTDDLGFIGRSEGMAALAVVLIEQPVPARG